MAEINLQTWESVNVSAFGEGTLPYCKTGQELNYDTKQCDWPQTVYTMSPSELPTVDAQNQITQDQIEPSIYQSAPVQGASANLWKLPASVAKTAANVAFEATQAERERKNKLWLAAGGIAAILLLR